MNANGYYIYRANSSSGTFSRVGQVLVGDNTDYSDMGLSEGKTFYYKVSAYNEAGESGKSSYVYATTIPAPTNIVAIAQDSYSIKVSWAKVANVDGYHVYRANSSSGTYENVGTVSSGSTVNYVDTGLEAGRTYFYKVCAYKGADTSSLSSYDYVATPLPKPTNVSAVGKSKAIEVSWNPVTGATGYYVYRAAVATDPYMKVGTITSGSVTVWENTGLSANKTYYYKVSAYNDSGEGSKSNYTSATTLSGSVPSVPTGVNAKGVDNSSIEVSWNKVTDANGYHVYRSVGNDLNYQNINTIDSGDTTTYKNTNLESGTEYYYRVTAYNANGESQKSDYSSAMPDPWLRPGKPYAPKNVAAEAISSSSVRISWDKTSDTDGYHIPFG